MIARVALALVLLADLVQAQTQLGLVGSEGAGQVIPSTPATNTETIPSVGTDYNSLVAFPKTSSTTRWNGNVITYSMPTIANCGANFVNCQFSFLSNVTDPTAAFIANVRYAVAQWQQVSALTFTEITETPSTRAVLRYYLDTTSTGANGACGRPANIVSPSTGVCVFYNGSTNWNTAPAPGTQLFTTTTHETGHAIGWEHPNATSPSPELDPSIDGRSNTVMSERRCLGACTANTGTMFYPFGIMILDWNAAGYYYPIPGAQPFRIGASNNEMAWNASTGMPSLNGVAMLPSNPSSNTIHMSRCDVTATETWNLSNYFTTNYIDIRPSGPWPVSASQPSPGVPPTGWSYFDSAQIPTTSASGASAIPGSVVVCAAKDAFIKNIITGHGANNVIYANANPNYPRYTGLGASDKVVFPDTLAGYTITALGTSDCKFVENSSSRWYRLESIETVQFSDQTKTLSSACGLS